MRRNEIYVTQAYLFLPEQWFGTSELSWSGPYRHLNTFLRINFAGGTARCLCYTPVLASRIP